MALGWLMSSWLFVGGIGCSGTDNSAEIMEAEKALAGNDFANAETKLVAVLQATPQDPKASGGGGGANEQAQGQQQGQGQLCHRIRV